MDRYEVEIPQFITHVEKTKTKKLKINGQTIYSGNLHHYTRAKVVKQLHEYLSEYIKEQLGEADLSHLFPLQITLHFFSPLNYGDIRMYKGNLSWKKPADDYEPSWDADNQWIWGKCFNDSLVKCGYVPDDNVAYIQSSGKVVFNEVEELDDRKLLFVIEKSKTYEH